MVIEELDDFEELYPMIRDDRRSTNVSLDVSRVFESAANKNICDFLDRDISQEIFEDIQKILDEGGESDLVKVRSLRLSQH